MLTIQDFALYLGAPCKAITLLRGEIVGTIDGVDIPTIRSSGHVKVDGIRLRPKSIKPILRSLSSLTEVEAIEMYETSNDKPWETPEWTEAEEEGYSCLKYWWRDYDDVPADTQIVSIGTPAIWRWLLAHHFDLFGWIESGEAIKAE